MRRKVQQAENDKTERVTGLGRRTREEIAKWNQMTTLRFQTGGETLDIPGLPSGFLEQTEKIKAQNLKIGFVLTCPVNIILNLQSDFRLSLLTVNGTACGRHRQASQLA